MTGSRDYLELSFESIRCFTDDGRLDAGELARLVAIAERDGEFDANEIRVLHNIVSRIRPHEVDAAMRAQLAELARKIGSTAALQQLTEQQ
jgi:hypothetical protein